MGPRPDDRGYADDPDVSLSVAWDASMGPRPDDRGYDPISRAVRANSPGFNGSTA